MMRQGENPQHVMHTLRQQHAEDGDAERAIIILSVTDEDCTKVLGSLLSGSHVMMMMMAAERR